ncbi:MAG: SPOR domain-containing protein [Acidobacteria bacterium]|nr:SPOR domain-containing protein [Acidobacteriota bacterium]
MTDEASPSPPAEDPALIGGRKALTVSFAVILGIGVILCGAYVAARTVSGNNVVRAATPATPPVTQPVIQPAIQPPAPEPTPAAPPAPAPAPKALPAAPTGGNLTAAELAGKNFLQVGALAPDAVEDYRKKLAAKGFTAHTAPGPDENTIRLLIGPLAPAELKSSQDALTQAGFACFPRTF